VNVAESKRLGLRRALVLVLLFFALTVPLSWLWLEWGQRHYGTLLFSILDPLYEATGIRRERGNPVAPRLVGLVPFLVLMAITPALPWRRRLIGAAVGVGLLVGFHLILMIVVDIAYTGFGRTRRAIATFVPLLIINDGLPLLVWIVCARDFLRRVVPGLAEPADDESTGERRATGPPDGV
jgi:hypothetical protein